MFFLLTGVASSLFMRGRCFSHDLIISSVRDTYVRKQRAVYCYCQTGLSANTTPHQALTAPSWAPPRMDSDVFTSANIRKYVWHRKDCTLHAASYESGRKKKKLMWSCRNFSFCRTTEQKRTVRCDSCGFVQPAETTRAEPKSWRSSSIIHRRQNTSEIISWFHNADSVAKFCGHFATSPWKSN